MKMAGTVGKTTVAILLLINLVVGCYTIVTIYRLVEAKQVNTVDLKWKSNIAKAYEMYFEFNVDETDKIHVGQVEEQEDSSLLELLSLLKPLCHLSGLRRVGLEDGGDKICPLRNWIRGESSFIYNGMTYQNGSITVPAAGVYHITSHVKFYVEDNRKNDNSSQTFHHQIVRYSASSRKQVLLFENVVTECREGINDEAHLEYPNMTGGLAQLDAADHVIVRVSHFDLLTHERVRDWHYFDMYLT